ncbi:MAG: prepilin-type N-terminal cleavage/methylation domain-containing protein [Lysobacter sp.]|nr:prepilin-type N-terminal cleavage/methylation domain-containing protein [Lysobacter sp.]
MPVRNTTAQRGLTLVEALIAMAIVTLLLAVAVPAWSSASESARAGVAQAALVEGLTRAVSHAANTGSEVVLCPGDAGGCRDSIDWTAGWVAWADLDGDRLRDANEALLQAQPALDGKVHLRSTSGRKRLVFQPSGGNAGSNVTFTLCDGRGPAKAQALVLANDGRLRATPANLATAMACMQPM